MQKLLSVLLAALFLYGCGGDDSAKTATAITLDTIGNKTVAVGDPVLTFTISATDPDGLTFFFATDGSVGAGANPYTETGTLASFNTGSGIFTWDVTSVAPGDYFVEFSVMNTNGVSDSEIIKITVQDLQLQVGETLYSTINVGIDSCKSCHGPAGRNGKVIPIDCVSDALYDSNINGGAMSSYASGWTTSDKAAVLYYLQFIDPTRCAVL